MKTIFRILTPVLGIFSLCSLYFFPLLHIAITSSLSENLMSSLGMKEYYSLNTLVQSLTAGDDTKSSLMKSIAEVLTDEESTIGAMFTNKGYLIAAIVFLFITVILIIVMSVFAAVSKRPLIGTCLSVGTLLSAFIMNKLFAAFAAPLISGEIGIASLLSSVSESLGSLSSLIGSMVSVKALELSIGYSFLMFAMFGVLVLGLCAVFEKSYEKK